MRDKVKYWKMVFENKCEENARLRAEVERLTLKPHERVIDTRRVNETIKSMEDDAIIRGGQALMERWGELKKSWVSLDSV